jgi:hypothetical protein
VCDCEGERVIVRGVCVCVCVCVCARARVRLGVCMSVRDIIYAYTHIYIYIYIHTLISTPTLPYRLERSVCSATHARVTPSVPLPMPITICEASTCGRVVEEA